MELLRLITAVTLLAEAFLRITPQALQGHQVPLEDCQHRRHGVHVFEVENEVRVIKTGTSDATPGRACLPGHLERPLERPNPDPVFGDQLGEGLIAIRDDVPEGIPPSLHVPAKRVGGRRLARVVGENRGGEGHHGEEHHSENDDELQPHGNLLSFDCRSGMLRQQRKN